MRRLVERVPGVELVRFGVTQLLKTIQFFTLVIILAGRPYFWTGNDLRNRIKSNGEKLVSGNDTPGREASDKG